MFGEREIDILTLGDFSHDYSLVVEFEGSADIGKTCAMVATALELVNFLGYKGEEVHANFWVDIKGAHQYDNAGMRQFIRDLFKYEYRHKIVMVDEIDAMYPSRAFADKLQIDEVLKLNQMTKTENWFMFTRHLGSAIDKIIRDCTNVSVSPLYNPVEDKIELEVLDGVDCLEELILREICPASEVFKRYKRWQPIK